MMRQDWIEIELGRIAKIFNGNSINARLKEEKYKVCETGLNYIGTKDIGFDGNIEYENGVRIPFDEPKFKIAPKGCVLVCSEGGSAGRKTGYIVEDVCFGNKLFAITNEYSVFEGKYVYYYTRYKKFFQEFKNQLNGIIGGVNAKKFSNIKIDLSPLPEQRAIVSKIEELFSDLDKGVTDLKKAQDQLKVYRQAVMKKAFEGELTKEWRATNKIDFNWEKTTTGEVMSNISSGSTPKAEFLFSSGEIQFLKVYNLNFDGSLNKEKSPVFTTIEIHESTNKRAICKPGDVLINIVGPPLGKVSVIPNIPNVEYNINQAIVRFRPNEKIISGYLSYFLQNPVTINWLEGTSKATAGQYNVKVTTCRAIPLELPCIKEQHQIVKEIETRLSVCEKVEESVSESLEKAEALRQSILKKAFEGRLLSNEEIEKCKAAPDYEPAAVLLEKIKSL